MPRKRSSTNPYFVSWIPVLLGLLLYNCNTAARVGSNNSTFYREQMRILVREISEFGKSFNPDFVTIAQNGLELMSSTAFPGGSLADHYVGALDAVAQEHVFYGLDGYGVPTDNAYSGYMSRFLAKARISGIQSFVIDYVANQDEVEDAYLKNYARGFISYASTAGDFNLDDIALYPRRPFAESREDIGDVQVVRNFLCLLNAHSYSSKDEYLKALASTNYDMLVIDPYYLASELLHPGELAELKRKRNGGKRLVIAYLNIGAAENFRYYWQKDWKIGRPGWLAAPYSDPYYDDEFWVRYWDDEWKEILVGNDASYLKKILDAGFDGVWLDNLEAYRFFEER